MSDMDQQAEVKELLSDWVLISYDIPAKEKQLRRTFIRDAIALGAEQFTESCYLLPFGDKAMELANKLESAGHAVVWQAHMPDEAKALEITAKYQDGVKGRCQVIEQRLVIAMDYIQKGWLKRARIMGRKTGKLLQELEQINENYDKPWLAERLQKLVKKWEEVHG